MLAPMHRHPVTSTTVESVGYDEKTAVLEIEFVAGAAGHSDGTVYDYYMVPPSVFHGLMKAESPGRFFGEFVRDKFSFRQV